MEWGGAFTDRLDASCYTRSRDTIPMSILPTFFDVFFAVHRLRQGRLRIETVFSSDCIRNRSETRQNLSYRVSFYIPSPDSTRSLDEEGLSRTLRSNSFKKNLFTNGCHHKNFDMA